jgi:hypothetical protein
MAGDRESEGDAVDDHLVRRLRDLEWPAPPPGLKERALEDFERRVEEAEAEAAAAQAHRA